MNTNCRNRLFLEPIIALLILLGFALSASAQTFTVATPDGYATANGGTTGGGDAAPTTVSTAAALNAAVSGNQPAVVVDSRKTYQGMFGSRDPLSDLDWVNEHVRHNHGPLCDVYPHEGMGCTGVCEGDTPAFMNLISERRGINDSEDPTQPSWGGQYVRKPNTNHFVDGPGKSSISRWRKDYQEEFKVRADWCVSAAQEPATVIDDAATTRIDSTLKSFVESGDIKGISALVYEKDKEAYFKAFGMADAEAGMPMSRDTIVQIFSMTKPVTGVALMKLHEQSKFELDDPVSKYIPSFANLKVATGKNEDGSWDLVDPKRPMTVRDLTRHTSGLAGNHGPAWVKELIADDPLKRENTLEEAVEQFSKIPLWFHPGEQWSYGPSVDVQARLVEILSGKKFDDYVQETILDPLKMTDTSYRVPKEKLGRMAGVYWRDDNTGELSRKAGEKDFNTKLWPMTPGGWGLTATIDDYMRFARMLQNDGELDGVRILKPETVKLMSTSHLSDEVKDRSWLPSKGQVGFGIDFAVRVAPSKSVDEPNGVVGEYFWDGAASTMFWIDPKNDLTAVMFVQLRPYDKIGLHNAFRNAVYGER